MVPVSHKYNVDINTLNEFSYDELVGMLVEDDSDEMMDKIEEIDDAIQSCELYKVPSSRQIEIFKWYEKRID